MSNAAFSVARDMIRSRRRPIKVIQRDLSGMTVALTGGTDGMGCVAARRLVEMKATLYLLGRNPEKTARTVESLNRLVGEERAFAVACDLASLASVRAGAASLLEMCPRIDLLINCAGMNTSQKTMSVDGYDMNWVVNYLGAYVLTTLLLERIRASTPARIVNLSSAMSRMGRIDFDDLQLTRGWSGVKAYAQAKLATNIATVAMARHLADTGVAVHALNPGFIRTSLLRDLKGMYRIGQAFMRWMASPPEVGAERILRVALDPEYDGLSGRFFDEDTLRPSGENAPDEDTLERLWALSQEVVHGT